MSAGNGSRRFVRFWWVLAFLAGVVAGAACVAIAGIPYTIWAIAGFGIPIAAVVGVMEWFGGNRVARPYIPHRGWRPASRAAPPAPKPPRRPKPSARRGQLHAIDGRKAADPPSS